MGGGDAIVRVRTPGMGVVGGVVLMVGGLSLTSSVMTAPMALAAAPASTLATMTSTTSTDATTPTSGSKTAGSLVATNPGPTNPGSTNPGKVSTPASPVSPSEQGAEDGPNLLVRGGPLVLLALVAVGVSWGIRRRRR